MIIELATKQDIDNWMYLVDKVKDNFPGFETEEAGHFVALRCGFDIFRFDYNGG